MAVQAVNINVGTSKPVLRAVQGELTTEGWREVRE